MIIHSPQAARERDVSALDDRLIRALQSDGRASVYELARVLGTSRDLVSRRLSALLEGERLRVVAALTPRFAGLHVLIHGGVLVDGPAAPVAEQIADLPGTVFVSRVAGVYPIVFESRHSDADELHATLERIRTIPSVRQIRVNTYDALLKEFITASSTPDVGTSVALDGIDQELIAILQNDGRTSYRALSEAVRLSPSSTRARVQRLIRAGVIRISAINTGGLSRNRVAIGIGITLRGDATPVRDLLVRAPAIDLVARSHGTYDFIATAVGTASAGILALIEELRALPEIGSLETWAHLDIVKEDYTRTLGPAIRS
ncbi:MULTISPECIES: Lrp/AsnC family transcriptional regulator [unclassified Microbacterium]|uniref:Lrp/AsnC family transcriptional regulator n=1 Tax=unclassified Microbacterium TaxID=2609290 RepID=UPI000EA9AADD|nr:MULTISPECIES: AsnC family transcriptional regulator [unclassified Microbacterium]MBT2483875.1 Lrp/AsnC family transcriptional regulator [Microbacterium sp. ISL-108]RKN66856.1 AsnC family transcriptional regulator [Microbacterium sp. CGR2]